MSQSTKEMDPLEPKVKEETCDISQTTKNMELLVVEEEDEACGMSSKLAFAIEIGRSCVEDKKLAKQLYKTETRMRWPKFPQFANFPREIRNLIWKSAIPGHRLIDIRIDPIGLLVPQPIPGEDFNEDSDEESSAGVVIWGVTDIQRDSQRLSDYANRYAAFEATSESRRETLPGNISTCLSTRIPDMPTDKYFFTPTQSCSRLNLHTPGIQFLKQKDTILITHTRYMPYFTDFTQDPHLTGREDILSIAFPLSWGFNSLDLDQHSSYRDFILRIKSTFPNAEEVFLTHKEMDWVNLARKNPRAGFSLANRRGKNIYLFGSRLTFIIS